MEKRGSGLRKIQKATSMLPTYKAEKEPFFESSRDFFFTTIPNANYGMTPAELARSVGKAEYTMKLYQKNIQNAGIIERAGATKNGYWRIIIQK